jgi:hypothetical protein
MPWPLDPRARRIFTDKRSGQPGQAHSSDSEYDLAISEALSDHILVGRPVLGALASPRS